ncbi:Reticulon-like protein [Drosera capensis]
MTVNRQVEVRQRRRRRVLIDLTFLQDASSGISMVLRCENLSVEMAYPVPLVHVVPHIRLDLNMKFDVADDMFLLVKIGCDPSPFGFLNQISIPVWFCAIGMLSYLTYVAMLYIKRENLMSQDRCNQDVADKLLWRDKSLTGSILVGFTITWFLFEIAEFHLITLLCYIMMTTMLFLFLWNYGSDLVNRSEVSIYQKRSIVRFNCLIRAVEDKWGYHRTVQYLFRSRPGKLHCDACFPLDHIHCWKSHQCSESAIHQCGFLCMITIPLMHERYEEEVDYIAIQGSRDMKRLYRKLDSKVLSRIPRGPVKEKKFK